MGYTHRHTKLLIGLGVSAIGDAWYAFAQNVKTVEEYINRVKHALPIVKGHILTGEDVVLREHISNVMCKGYTKWDRHTAFFEALSVAIERLRQFEDDGLVEINSSGDLRLRRLVNVF